MLIFLISFFSFLLVSKSFLKPFSSWSWKLREVKTRPFSTRTLISIVTKGHVLSSVKKSARPVAENVLKKEEFSLLDLPDLALECILERISPAGLCSMAAVCSSLREMCTSDHMWDKHMQQKWGRLIGEAATQQWKCYIESKRRDEQLEKKGVKNQIFGYCSRFLPKFLNGSKELRTPLLPEEDSVMARYLAIESGKFWFPAQVFNRENGHVGFMLSCYDAELNYDSSTDTFAARYSVNGRRTIEDNIEWNRIRAPAVDTPPYVLHLSECLNDLKPGDHIEIQWRRNKDFPYGWWYGVVGHLELCDGNESHCQCHLNGWWYGVVGHLELCDGNESHCQCHLNDTVVLEFKQYNPGSRWRQTTIDRKDHREVGNGADGFYGGIRKLHSEQEISMWKCLWPTSNLQQ